ncbi:hypothetical protein FRC02_007398, partial [Tulasnella sp. 418]
APGWSSEWSWLKQACHQLHTVSEATEDSPHGSAFPTFIPFHDPGRTMGGVTVI